MSKSIDKLYIPVELGRMAIARQQTSELMVWALSRTVDMIDGNGESDSSMPIKELRAACRKYSIDTREITKAMNAGYLAIRPVPEGMPELIGYTSAAKLGIMLGIDTKRSMRTLGDTAELPLGILTKEMNFKANVYAAWWAWMNGGGRYTVARENLAEMWGHSGETLRKWERMMGIKTVAQYARTTSEDDTAQYAPRDARRDDSSVYAQQAGGLMVWQTANRYESNGIVLFGNKYSDRQYKRLSAGLLDDRADANEKIFYTAEDLDRLGSNWQKSPSRSKRFLIEDRSERRSRSRIYDLSAYRPISKKMI